MKANWPRLGRAHQLVSLVAVGLVAVALAIPLKASALPMLVDAHFYYTGGDVTIDVLHYDSAYDEVLQIWTPLGRYDVVTGSHVGSQTTLTMEQLADMGIGVGDELRFALQVQNTGNHFFLGSGDLNADGFSHAYVRSASGRYYVSFEDLWGGGDRDYNDTVVRLSGGMTTDRTQRVDASATTQVAEPSLLLLLVPAIGLLAWKSRRM